MVDTPTRTLADLKELAQAVPTDPEIAPPTPKIDAQGPAYATGRRKDAVARVWVKPGSGRVTINGRDLAVYFARPVSRMVINQPFVIASRVNQFDVHATVKGGGLSGQAGALRHGISRALVAYDPKYVSGWVVERYQIDLVAAAEAARARMDEQLRAMCAAAVPGDTHRNLQVEAHYSRQTFKHVLMPVWLLSYRFGARNFQVVINGYTGEIAGDYPKSWIKILLTVLFVIIVVAVLAVLFGEG